MRFDALLGNDETKRRLEAALDSGRTSHAYLIAGPAGSGKRTLARLLAAGLECTGAGRPCGVCRACRKVLGDAHPDVITVDDPDRRQLPVDLIRRMRSDAFVRPNEGAKKVFVVPRAQDMNESGQNALLKVLEEPPAYGVFLLLADAPEKLLPTIRSRCVELHMAPLGSALLRRELARRCPEHDSAVLGDAVRRSEGFLGRALELLDAPLLPQTGRFAEAYAARDTLALLELFCSMGRLKRDQLAPVLEQLGRLLGDALMTRQGARAPSDAARAIAEAHTNAELLAACEDVRAAWRDCWANVGAANLCAGLFVRLQGTTATSAAMRR